MNCRLFQLALFDAVGLVDGTGNYRTRGAGCPALAPLRRLAFRITGRRYWPTNLPPPGARVADVDRVRSPTAAAVVAEVGLYLSYRGHDARFHWFTHVSSGLRPPWSSWRPWPPVGAARFPTRSCGLSSPTSSA